MSGNTSKGQSSQNHSREDSDTTHEPGKSHSTTLSRLSKSDRRLILSTFADTSGELDAQDKRNLLTLLRKNYNLSEDEAALKFNKISREVQNMIESGMIHSRKSNKSTGSVGTYAQRVRSMSVALRNLPPDEKRLILSVYEHYGQDVPDEVYAKMEREFKLLRHTVDHYLRKLAENFEKTEESD